MRLELEALDPKPKRRLTDEEFLFCYSRVPCLCIDFVIVQEGGVLFAKRTIEPFKGYWTLPGGIWRYKEPIDEACVRLLSSELGIICVAKKQVGHIHHLHDGEFRSSVSLPLVIKYEGTICGSNQGRKFKSISDFSASDIQPYQAAFFRECWNEVKEADDRL